MRLNLGARSCPGQHSKIKLIRWIEEVRGVGLVMVFWQGFFSLSFSLVAIRPAGRVGNLPKTPGSDRVGSGQEAFEISRAGLGRLRKLSSSTFAGRFGDPHPTRPDKRELMRPVWVELKPFNLAHGTVDRCYVSDVCQSRASGEERVLFIEMLLYRVVVSFYTSGITILRRYVGTPGREAPA